MGMGWEGVLFACCCVASASLYISAHRISALLLVSSTVVGPASLHALFCLLSSFAQSHNLTLSRSDRVRLVFAALHRLSAISHLLSTMHS